MNSSLITLILSGVLIAALILYAISIYNRLVALKQRFENAFAQVAVQLKRRYDLIPNLVATAKGYLAHEKETLEGVINARNEASAMLKHAAQSPLGAAMPKLAGAESLLQRALGQLKVVMEDYPALQANEVMMQLSEELSATENRVAFARQAFNDAVMTYNTYRQSFPPILLAAAFGHGQDATLLAFSDRQQLEHAPAISFL